MVTVTPLARLGRSGALLAGAGVAAVLALATQWSGGTGSTYVPGWYVPGMCTTVYDNDGWPSMDCTSGYLSPGMVLPGTGAVDGKAAVVRVFVAAVVVVTILAWRRGSTRLARAALLVAAAGLLLAGVRPRAGQVAYLAGMALLALALRSRGLLTGRAPRPRPDAAPTGLPGSGSPGPRSAAGGGGAVRPG